LAALYLHIPFCTKRCVYCDFYFVTTQRDHGPFVRAMRAEIDSYGRAFGAEQPIETIYLGGGTPSMLSLEEVAALLEPIYQHFDCSAVREIGFEANPENASKDYLSGLRALGVTRLSLGIQSFYEDDLAFMGRAHDAATAQEALENAIAAGFESVSVDLIFGLPDQPIEHWMANLERASASKIDHISTYGLTVEERTPLANQVARGLVTPTPEGVMGELFFATIEYLSGHGFEQYEVSNFARPGGRSQHNQIYWRHENYVGFGPSAHSLRWEGRSRAVRWSNVRSLPQYVALLEQKQRPLEHQERLGLDDLADEFLMLRLRLPVDGLDLDILEQRYGVDLLSEKVDELAAMERSGLATLRNGILRLTPRGILVADAVTARLLPDSTQVP
jgi:oxygen-independent coproporphyrinogen III oxidase